MNTGRDMHFFLLGFVIASALLISLILGYTGHSIFCFVGLTFAAFLVYVAFCGKYEG